MIVPSESSVRLLVIDEEPEILGGVDRVRERLLPALARLTETLIWVVPEYKLRAYGTIAGESSKIILESFSWPKFSWPNLPQLAGKRWEKVVGNPSKRLGRLQRQSIDKRLRHLVQKYSITHVLVLCVFHHIYAPLGVPTLAVIYDLNCLVGGQVELESVFRYWLKAADRILTISETTRTALGQFQPKELNKVQTILLGSNAPFGDSAPSISSRPAVFYYPAAANPHKDHLTLFKAAAAISKLGFDFKIVLTGGRTEQLISDQAFLQPELEAARRFYFDQAQWLKGRVEALGYVSSSAVEDVFRQSTCVVLPSVFEGYGLPLVEALEHGIPVIASDISAFREQVELFRSEKWVDFFPAGDAGKLATLLLKRIECSFAREARSSLNEQLSQWTWTHVARAYVDAMRFCPQES